MQRETETRMEYFERLKREAPARRRQAKYNANNRVDYYVGVHIGQVTRPAALAIIGVSYDYGIANTRYAVSHVEQFKAGTDFPHIVDRAAHVFGDTRIQEACGRALVIDATYCGMALLDLLDARIKDREYMAYRVEDTGMSVSGVTTKQDLTVQMQRLLQERRIQVSPDVQDAGGLMREMKDFRVQVSETGAVQFGGGPKHPRVAAIAIAVWHAFWWERAVWPGFTEQAR